MSEATTVTYDPAKTLTIAALLFVAYLIVFVSVVIFLQLERNGEANTESWAALTGLVGWATGTLGVIFSARYGTTQANAKKDETIQVLSQTAAVSANTAQAQVAAATPAPPAPARVGEMNVDATGADINITGTKP